MAQLRNISDDALELAFGDGRTRLVEPDALLDVDDVWYLQRAWPETLWRVVSEPAAPVSVEDGPPAVSSVKAVWVAYATQRGATPEYLDTATKDDLIRDYGQEA